VRVLEHRVLAEGAGGIWLTTVRGRGPFHARAAWRRRLLRPGQRDRDLVRQNLAEGLISRAAVRRIYPDKKP
jgi:hypothetical protein